jgi:hypothetical protein
MLLVNSFALGTIAAAKAASDCNSDGDSCGQPDRYMAGKDAGSGTDASAKREAETDLRRRFFHVRLPLRTDPSRTQVRSE